MRKAKASRVAQLLEGEKASFEERLRTQDAQVAELRAHELSLRKNKARIEDWSRECAEEQARASSCEAEFQKTIAGISAKLGEAQRKAEQGFQQL